MPAREIEADFPLDGREEPEAGVVVGGEEEEHQQNEDNPSRETNGGLPSNNRKSSKIEEDKKEDKEAERAQKRWRRTLRKWHRWFKNFCSLHRHPNSRREGVESWAVPLSIFPRLYETAVNIRLSGYLEVLELPLTARTRDYPPGAQDDLALIRQSSLIVYQSCLWARTASERLADLPWLDAMCQYTSGLYEVDYFVLDNLLGWLTHMIDVRLLPGRLLAVNDHRSDREKQKPLSDDLRASIRAELEHFRRRIRNFMAVGQAIGIVAGTMPSYQRLYSYLAGLDPAPAPASLKVRMPARGWMWDHQEKALFLGKLDLYRDRAKAGAHHPFPVLDSEPDTRTSAGLVQPLDQPNQAS